MLLVSNLAITKRCEKIWKIMETLGPGELVLIWKDSVRAFLWIPTWLGLDDFHNFLRHCPLDKEASANKDIFENNLFEDGRLNYSQQEQQLPCRYFCKYF